MMDGSNGGSTANIDNSYSLGNVTMTSSGYAGGLVGEVYVGNVTNCYSSGSVSPNNATYSGGLVGYYYIGNVTSSYFDSTITGKTSPTNQARTTQQLKQKATFTGWDFTNIWHIDEGTSYPYLLLISIPYTITVTDVKKDSISISWSPLADTIGYDLEVDGTIIDDGANTTYTHTGLKPGTKHTYRVRSKNGKGVSSWGPMLTVSTLIDSPLNIRTHTDGNSIIVDWDQVEGATGYDIEVDGVTFDNGTNISYSHSNISPNSQHVYRVRVKTASTTSKWSQPVTDINWSSDSPGVCLAAVNWPTSSTKSDDIQILVKANNFSDMYAAFFELQYDPSQVQLDDSSISNLVWTDGDNLYQVIKHDPTTGKIRVLISQTGKNESKNGQFDILGLKLKFITGSTANIKVNLAEFVDSSGKKISIPDISDLHIIVLSDT
ncbi:MAG: fibronectin type III domain-containing protein, partial [Bacillota bacterium]|nr:fibronectin type III domain-containing protein [Bacillota bacterium]